MGTLTQTERFVTIVFTDLEGSTAAKAERGDAIVIELIERHAAEVRHLLGEHGGREIRCSGDGFILTFDRPSEAVLFALELQRVHHRQSDLLPVRVGIHLGEVSEMSGLGEESQATWLMGLAVDLAGRIEALALPGQVLLSAEAFNFARQRLRGTEDGEAIVWLAHGEYLLKGVDVAMPMFEAGIDGVSPLRTPPESEKARRQVHAEEEELLGWRPAAGLTVPGRDHWRLEKQLGEGGFGEVWLAEHVKTHEHRVFKFCFDAQRLRGLKREVALFRLIRETLGERPDIARILDWEFEKAPHYLEAQWAGEGNLSEWFDAHGGIAEVPLETRLEIIAQTADALAAAHSVGVLHRDIKPSNILISTRDDKRPQAVLTDFGIGVVTERQLLESSGITATGLTQMSLETSGSTSRSGTRIYMAPEVEGGSPPSTRSDIYSLGVVLYQMLVGDLRVPVPPDWSKNIGDPLLRADLTRCLAGDPEDRWRDATALAGSLRHLRQRRAKRLGRRAAIATVACAAVALLTGYAIHLVGEAQETRQRRQAEQVAEERFERLRSDWGDPWQPVHLMPMPWLEPLFASGEDWDMGMRLLPPEHTEAFIALHTVTPTRIGRFARVDMLTNQIITQRDAETDSTRANITWGMTRMVPSPRGELITMFSSLWQYTRAADFDTVTAERLWDLVMLAPVSIRHFEDGSMIFVTRGGQVIHIDARGRRRLVGQLELAPWSCEIGPDGRWLISIKGLSEQFEDSTSVASVYDLESPGGTGAERLAGREIEGLLFPQRPRAMEIAFSPDGRHAALTYRDDSRIHVVDLSEARLVNTLGGHASHILDLFYLSEDILVSVDQNSLRAWDTLATTSDHQLLMDRFTWGFLPDAQTYVPTIMELRYGEYTRQAIEPSFEMISMSVHDDRTLALIFRYVAQNRTLPMVVVFTRGRPGEPAPAAPLARLPDLVASGEPRERVLSVEELERVASLSEDWPVVSIAEIHRRFAGSASPELEATGVVVEGIVTAAQFPAPTRNHFAIRDSTGGIMLDDNLLDGVINNDLRRGDTVRVRATVEWYFGNPQLHPQFAIERIDRPDLLPLLDDIPVITSEQIPEHVGEIVRLESVRRVGEYDHQDHSGPQAAGRMPGDDPVTIFIRDASLINPEDWPLNATRDVTGLITAHGEEFAISPRDPEDLGPIMATPESL